MRARDGRVGVATLVACAGLAVCDVAWADPQANLGITTGLALQDVAGPRSLDPAFHVGGRADVLFLRSKPGQMALGPYADVATAGFTNVDAGAGLEWLLPVTTDMPLVLSAGAFARNGDGRSWAPGMEGTAFFGSRSFNFHSWYGLTVGLFVQGRWVPDPPATADVVIGLQLDAELFVLPALLLYGALHH